MPPAPSPPSAAACGRASSSTAARRRACVTGTLMASPAPRHALAAVQILRESRKLDYDLIVTDSANRASLAMCQAMGYQVVSPDSLEWACVFDPASLALHKIAQRLGHALARRAEAARARRRSRRLGGAAGGGGAGETFGLARRGGRRARPSSTSRPRFLRAVPAAAGFHARRFPLA